MVWKLISVALLSTVKTQLKKTIDIAEGLSFFWTFVSTAIGGIIGFVVFYFFIDRIIALLKRKDEIVALTQKKIRKARQIISWKRKYPIGLFIFILPLLSIPVMAFIIKRFYNHNKKVFSLSFVSVTVFSLLGCILFSPILAIV